MKENGWIKHFSDGSKEFGYDSLVRTGKASWSRGRLYNICRVELFHNGKSIIINGVGEFWQSDTFEARLFINEGKLIKRTLCKKLDTYDNFIVVSETDHSFMVDITNTFCEYNSSVKPYPISPDWIGKWLIVDMEKEKTLWRIGDV